MPPQVWDKNHERQLNCIDPDSQSKLILTTRIRGLVKGCEEISLSLLAPGESVDLLLRTGNVTEPDEAAKTAAGKIAERCGNLPLLLSITGVQPAIRRHRYTITDHNLTLPQGAL